MNPKILKGGRTILVIKQPLRIEIDLRLKREKRTSCYKTTS